MTQLDAATAMPASATRFRYPASAMAGDYLRAAAGLVPIAIIFSTVSVGVVAGVVLGGFAVIFGAFAIRTGLRHGTSIEIDDCELRTAGLRPVTIAWNRLDRMKLAYYSTRRDRKSGWMQLQLAAAGARLSLDSRLDGFDRLVRQAAIAAAGRGLELSEATAANLQALGIRVPDHREPR
ncbi:MAG TPA: hypothetical protein VMB84_03775 [Stellaceae bacterium]|nr:hypothetical protein [Stellaceae bacterium]